MNETLFTALALIPALVFAIVFHEVAHGWMALALGDPTAKERRRLSLNPLRHVDPFGTVILPGLLALSGAPVFGWAKPVPVTKERLNNPHFGMMAVAAAGPGTNLILAAVAAIVLGLVVPAGGHLGASETGMPMIVCGDNSPALFASGMFFFILINVFLAIFNLLPFPPFDGSHIVEGLLPERLARAYERLRPYGLLLFFALVAISWFAPQVGLLENTIGGPVDWAITKYLTLAQSIAGR
ncbi:site-2 protease family protein [Altererythrobacter salegens]|uniref:Site-2 protease family protein n=1 Tax=Croceibacterium salegens TaxID=1737568 RepID=A0A6I4SQ78_9SPHN|nr:site-2 protease family protein [Croceibacterium salegens]MXO57965.1 site-2 protease family protein [Croceibacterium salegens]